MASTSETGHAKNVANFEIVISSCNGYGAVYNPTKNCLKIPQLQSTLTSAKNSLQLVKTTWITFENARNARELAISNGVIKKYSTRILNALESTDASKLTVDDAKAINRKIQGKRAGSKSTTIETTPQDETPATPEEIHIISASQQSYDNLIDNFAKLVVCISSEPSYSPNEADLKIASLNAALTNYRNLNTGVINAWTPYKNSLINRFNVLYQDNTGLVDVASEIKKYVKSVFGATSQQYKQISKIQFKKYKK